MKLGFSCTLICVCLLAHMCYPVFAQTARTPTEARSQADALAEYQWRQQLQAVTLPKMLRTVTEARVYQLGTNWQWMSQPLVILNEMSNPRMFHLLKQCTVQRTTAAQPIALCGVRLYRNGTLLGGLAIYPEQGTLGIGKTWTVMPKEFTDWMATLKQPGGLYSAQNHKR